MVVLNENIHEFDYKEKRSIKGIIKDWLYKETYEERIEELEKRLKEYEME